MRSVSTSLSSPYSSLCVAVAALLTTVAHHVQLALSRPSRALRARGEAGQTTAEYALIILGAATVALLVIAWATKTTKVGKMLDAVVDSVISKVT